METVLKWLSTRPLRLIGGFLVFFSIGLLVFLILLDVLVGLDNPYLGIITYMILPAILVLGLVLVPLDSWIQRRRQARGEPPYPVIDLCNPQERKIAVFFAISSVIVLVVGTVATYKGIEYMDTVTFCGEVCHKIMIPEFTAYKRSPHASVACVECHIGPGTSWFVRSKLTGIPQVWHYTLGDYPRPIPTPVQALRPSRDTCENCHWPEEFYGSTLKTYISYQQDRANTRTTSTMLMYVGSGGVPGSGIHSHMISRIHYLPAVANRGEMAWVRIQRPDGSSQEFVNPSYSDSLKKLRQNEDVRLMDCIDCHNRAAHNFVPFENLLDDAITRRQVDPSLPFIKKEAMQAVETMDSMPTKAQQKRTVRRIGGIESFYERELSDVYRTHPKAIHNSVKVIQRAYLDTAFPHMRIWPGSDTTPATYTNWRTHDGCFRCHGTLVAERAGGRGEDISADCNLCHSTLTSAGPATPATSE